jgi:hypothetical protein
MGEAAALSLSKGMRRGQDSPVDRSQKRPGWEPWSRREDRVSLPILQLSTLNLKKGKQKYSILANSKESITANRPISMSAREERFEKSW